MKKIIFSLLAIASLSFIGCSKDDTFEPIPEATVLNLKFYPTDNAEYDASECQIFIWDATNNDLVYDLDNMPIDILNTAGQQVSPISVKYLNYSYSNSGVKSDYLYTIFNVDDMLYYDNKSQSGKFLIWVWLEKTYSSYPNAKYVEVNWTRGVTSEVKIDIEPRL